MANQTEDGDELEAPKAKKSKAVPMMLGLNTVLVVVVLVFAMRKPATAVAPAAAPAPAAAHGEEAAPAGGEEVAGPTVKLENFIIQLRTVDTDRYCRLALDLELGTEIDKNVVNARTSRVRDAIISYFSDRTLDELRGSEGMERTKATLMKRLGEIVGPHRIKGLYITDFVIQ